MIAKHVLAMLASQTGLSSKGLEIYLTKNNLDALKISMDIGQKKLNFKDLVTAISGYPNNQYDKKIKSTYRLSESTMKTKTQIIEDRVRPIISRLLREDEYNYYRSEFQKISQTDSEYPTKLKMQNEHAQTKWIDLNAESIPVLIAFLKVQLKKLNAVKR